MPFSVGRSSPSSLAIWLIAWASSFEISSSAAPTVKQARTRACFSSSVAKPANSRVTR